MAVSVQYWKLYVGDSTKLSRKSENAVASNHVLKFVFDAELQFITAQVQASMRDRCYKVQVRFSAEKVGTVLFIFRVTVMDIIRVRVSFSFFYSNITINVKFMVTLVGSFSHEQNVALHAWLFVQVQLGTEGSIINAQCECVLQCHKCHHVAAALLFG